MSDTPTPEPKPTPTPRRRRRGKWLGLFALIVFMGVLFYVAWIYANHELIRRQSDREWQATRSEVEQIDPDWTWERLNAARTRPPAGRNAAELIPQIKKLSHADWGKELAKEEWKPLLEVQPNVRYSPTLMAIVRRDLAASKEAVDLARTLKDYPQAFREIVLKPNVLDTLLEDTQSTRLVADLLRWDVVAALEDGNHPRAAANLLALLNASRSIGDEPFLISQMVRMAVRTVAVRAVERFLASVQNPPSLSEFQLALAVDAEEPLLLHGVRGDRAAFDKLFENLDSGAATPAKTIDSGFNDSWARLGWWHYRAHLPADRAALLSFMTQCAEYARLPIHEQPAAFATIVIPPNDPRRLLSHLLLPAVDRVTHAHWRTTAEARCAVAGIACEQFRQKNKRWPQELAELVPTYISAIPLDPFDGQPLRFAKLSDGVVVYSVGKRLPSEFGNPTAVRPELPEGVDVGFRLWNTDQRRLLSPAQPIPPDHEPPP